MSFEAKHCIVVWPYIFSFIFKSIGVYIVVSHNLFHNPYRPIFDHYLRWLRDTGITDHLQIRRLPIRATPGIGDAAKGAASLKALDMRPMLSPLMFLGIGLSISVVAFCAEIIAGMFQMKRI